MSLELDSLTAPISTDHAESGTKSSGSYSGCSRNASESDFESGLDEWTSARRANAVGVSGETLARFWAKVQPSTGCWLWTANRVRGYGQFVLSRDLYGKQPHVYAHRFAYELVHGSIGEPAIKACHHCDNPICVRPSHLFLGSQADNLADARAKGRLVEGLHRVRLTDADMAAIRVAYRPRVNGRQLAARYGVTLNTVLRIVSGRYFRARHHLSKPFQAPVVEPARGLGLADRFPQLFELVRTVDLPVVDLSSPEPGKRA